MQEVVIYTTQDSNVQLNVNLSENIVWLSLDQMAELFGRDKSAISRHLSQVFKAKERERDTVVAKFATTSCNNKSYQSNYYNLDAILLIDRNKHIYFLFFSSILDYKNMDIMINDNGLVALALLIAESQFSQKDLMIRLIVNLLMN